MRNVNDYHRNKLRIYQRLILIYIAFLQAVLYGYFAKFNNDLDTLFMMLQNIYGVELKERKSLIIFDEVQRYPTAREM